MTGLWRRLTAFAAAGALTLAALPAAAEDWIRADSDHFTIYSTASEGKTRAYVHNLEQFRGLTNLLLGTSDTAPQVKFVIYLIPQENMIKVRPYFSNYVGGVYLNCAEGTSAYSGYTRMDAFDDEDEGLITLLHEYSHYVMFQHARTVYPVWYVEGFAEFLSTANAQRGKITVGEGSKGRTSTLDADRWIDFAKVLDPQFGFTGAKGNDTWEVESFYAQSWLLTHYMLSDPARAKALNAYFGRLTAGEAPIPAWEAATGLKVAELKGILSRYRNSMFYLNVPINDYPDSAITLTHVAPAAQSYLFDASLLTTCPAGDQGKAILARLQAQKAAAGGDAHFRTALARAQLLYGDADAALTDMDTLAAADPANAEASYLLGRALLKEADAKKGAERNELVDEARGAFIAAYKLNKLDAPNLYFLGQSFSDKPGFPDKNVMNAASGAHVLAPGVTDYAVFAAFADLANDQRDAAAALLTPFVSDPHNRDAAQHFKAAIDAIHAGKPVGEVMHILNSAGAKAQ